MQWKQKRPAKGQELGMVEHAFNPTTEASDLCEFKASLIYIESSRLARAT